MRLQFNQKSEIIFEKIILEPKIEKIIKYLINYDMKLYLHTIRVTLLSIDIGVERNFTDKELYLLGKSAILHDLAKISIPPYILNKKIDELDQNEVKLIKEVPRKTFDILKNFQNNFIRKIIVSHHEFYETQSFPRKRNKKEEFISIDRRQNENTKVEEFSQILSIANLFETSFSNYHKNITEDNLKEIVSHIKNEFLGNQSLINNLIEKIRIN